MPKDELLALADRIEAADGPSRELDAVIARATCWRWDGWEEGDRKIEDRPLEDVIRDVHFSNLSVWRYLPAYTASLDVAMTLVPEGYDWEVARLNGGLTIHARCGSPEYVFAATPALALCAAAIRAKAEETRDVD